MKLVTSNTFKDFLNELNSQNTEIGFLAGGTNIMLDEKRGTNDKKTVYNLSSFNEELQYIKTFENYIEVGALITINDLLHHPAVVAHLPQLVKSLESIGSKQVRNMGTLVGNLANASSIGDAIPVLLTIDAKVNIISAKGERTVSVDNFIIDYKKTCLAPNEIIKSISLPVNKLGSKYDFFKVAVRPTATISKVNLAYAKEGNIIRLASGGVNKIPTRLFNTEKLFEVQNLSRENFEETLNKDVSPISDLRSTSQYRKSVLLNLIFSIYQLK